MIIAGALELTKKTARDAMTPISETFAIDVNAKLDRYSESSSKTKQINQFHLLVCR
jgi:CBS domain containing-hemolysin-like protein